MNQALRAHCTNYCMEQCSTLLWVNQALRARVHWWYELQLSIDKYIGAANTA